MDEVLFLLWSNKHNAWWRPDSRGYTDNRAEAGRYTQAEALERVLASSFCMLLSQVTCMVADCVDRAVEVLHICHGCRAGIAVADQRRIELSTGPEYWHDACLSRATQEEV